MADQKSKPEWSLSNVSIKAPLRRKRARERSGDSVAAGIPAVVNEVLSSSGRPLDREVHSAMEAGFGANMNTVGAVSPTFSGIGVSRPSDPAEKEADRTASLVVANAGAPRRERGEGFFNMVRVHSDAKAGESAQAVNAQAYTVGNHIVFAPGKYTPQTPSGRKLLAHELTHVVQHQAGCRAGISRFEVQDCDEDNPMETSASVKEAHSLATKMLQSAIAIVNSDKADPLVVKAAANHFNLTFPPANPKDKKHWDQVKRALSSMTRADKNATYECEPKQNWWNGGCISGVEAISLWNIHLCPLWWKDHGTALERGSILLHEWGHKWGKGVNRIFETYRFDKDYASLPTEKRLQQPDAYMGFVYELWTGAPPNF